MSAQRVLGTEQALHAAQQLQAILTGGVKVHLRQVTNSGRALSDPGLWDGPEAARFRQDWPQIEAVIKQLEPDLERLQTQAQSVVQNILRAGGDGAALEPQGSAAHQDGGGGGGILGFVHVGLAVASFIPVVGTGASLVDAGIYAAQGDYVDAGISALGAVPVVGEAADAVKAGRLVAEGVDEGVKLARASDEGAHLISAGEDGATAVLPNTPVFRIYGANEESGGGLSLAEGAVGPDGESIPTGARPFGQSWTTQDPASMTDPRAELGLPNENPGRFLIRGVLKDPTGVTSRTALPLDGQPGGGPELLIPDAENQVEIQGVEGVNPEF